MFQLDVLKPLPQVDVGHAGVRAEVLVGNDQLGDVASGETQCLLVGLEMAQGDLQGVNLVGAAYACRVGRAGGDQ